MTFKKLDDVLDLFGNHFSILDLKNDKESIKQRRDLAFELLSCTTVFDVSPYYAKDYCWNVTYTNNGGYACNGQDGKIDGYFIKGSEDEIVVNVLQAKHTENISVNEISLFFSSVNKYLVQLNCNLVDGYKSLKQLIELIQELKDRYPDASLKYNVFVCAGANKKIIEIIEQHFVNEFQDINNINYKYVSFEDILNKVNEIRRKILHGEANDTRIKLSPKTMSDPIEYKQSKVAVLVLDAKEIRNLIDTEFKNNFELSRLFSGNVRGFLDKTDVNQSIKDTIENSAPTFLSKNNGAVIVCENLEVQPDKKSIIIKNPVIVNGQQTISTIFKYAKTKSQLEKVEVLVKFIEIPNNENKNKWILEIARASNQSNSIDELDLLANRELFKELVKDFGTKGIYLKVKEGELLNEIFMKGTEIVKFNDLLQIWVSIYLKRPSDAKAVKKNVGIFSKAYNNQKYQLLASKDNILHLKEMFNHTYKIFKFKESVVKDYFKNELYYEHAQYFILYLLDEIRSSDLDITNLPEEKLEEAKVILSNLIAAARERKENENKEFTFNNYFKSTQPQQDFLAYQGNNCGIKKIDAAIQDLFPEG